MSADRPTTGMPAVLAHLGLDDPPSFSRTFRRADGEDMGEYGWVTDQGAFDYDDEPVELVEETWERVSVRRVWHLPEPIGACEVDDHELCEEDAIGWARRADSVWLRACVQHEERIG